MLQSCRHAIVTAVTDEYSVSNFGSSFSQPTSSSLSETYNWLLPVLGKPLGLRAEYSHWIGEEAGEPHHRGPLATGGEGYKPWRRGAPGRDGRTGIIHTFTCVVGVHTGMHMYLNSFIHAHSCTYTICLLVLEWACLSVRLPACLRACLVAWLAGCLAVYLSVCCRVEPAVH